MKAIKLLSALLFLLFFSISCHKDGIKIGRACTAVLDHWVISTGFEKPNVQKQIDIFFPSEQVGYSVGNSGAILKTIDGGASWDINQLYYTPGGVNHGAITKAMLHTVFFVDESTGYAGGSGETFTFEPEKNTDAVLISTTDGGIRWKKTYLEDVVRIDDLFFSNQQEGIGLFRVRQTTGHQQKCMRTEDGGKTWSTISIPPGELTSSSFARAGNKIILTSIDNELGPVLLVSEDQGNSWTRKSIPMPSFDSVYFIDDDHGFVSTWDLTLRTKDGGDSWEELITPFDRQSLIHFHTPTDGFIIRPVTEWSDGQGGGSHRELLYYDVFQTKDGGERWTSSRIHMQCNVIGPSHAPSENFFYTLGKTGNKFTLR